MHVVVIVLMAMLILSNCAPRVIPGPVYLYPKVEHVDIELKSFSFYPNHIAIFKDQSPFIFRLKNTAQIKHNFILIDRRKNILINVDLMPDESTIVTHEPSNQVIIHFTVTGSFIVARVWKGCLWWQSRMFKFITHKKGHIVTRFEI